MATTEKQNRTTLSHVSLENSKAVQLDERSIWSLAAIVPSLSRSQTESWEVVRNLVSKSIEHGHPDLESSIAEQNALGFLKVLLDTIDKNSIRSVETVDETSSARLTFRTTTSSKDAIHWLRLNCLAAIEACSDTARGQEAEASHIRRSIYNFAYGLSHEINNPLANISARAQMLLAKARSDEDRKTLATIIDQSQRAHEMLAEAMLVVQPPKSHFTTINLVNSIRDIAESYVPRTAAKGLLFSTQLSCSPIVLQCDLDAMRESIAIAIENAIEACRPGDHIHLIVQLETIEGNPEKECRVAVVDNGPGMSTRNAEQAWDLYFSGRDAGRGLGIGLAKLKRLIELNHGRTWIETAENAGLNLEMRFTIDR